LQEVKEEGDKVKNQEGDNFISVVPLKFCKLVGR